MRGKRTAHIENHTSKSRSQFKTVTCKYFPCVIPMWVCAFSKAPGIWWTELQISTKKYLESDAILKATAKEDLWASWEITDQNPYTLMWESSFMMRMYDARTQERHFPPTCNYVLSQPRIVRTCHISIFWNHSGRQQNNPLPRKAKCNQLIRGNISISGAPRSFNYLEKINLNNC